MLIIALSHLKKNVVSLALIIFAILLARGQIIGLWAWLCVFGLFGIALGLIRFPRKQGFALIALGAFLITVYSLALQVWVFVVLNIIFFTVNVIEFRKK